MTKKQLIKKCEDLEWNIKIDNNYYLFNKFSPEGQDFNIEVYAENINEVIEQIYERYNNFDVSEETYLWLDNTGHGVNGAPYDMKDLYEDMENCKEMILELYNKIKQ